MKQTTALNKDQLQCLENCTKMMLELVDDNDDYAKWCLIIDALPESDIFDLARLGFMYLATERARRYVASTN